MSALMIPKPVRISDTLFLEAAKRLVSQTQPDVDQAAKRLVASAPGHGIDLSWVHATLRRDASGRVVGVRQACLPVPGSGKTAMVFISEPPITGEIDGAEIALGERAACIDATCRFLATHAADSLRVAQALPEVREDWAIRAFLGAGFHSVGELLYMRRTISPQGISKPSWAPNTEIVPFASLGSDRDRTLIGLLDETYVDTLDCPELCGVRETSDVLESHKRVGTFDAGLWFIVRKDRVPRGCILLNPNPDARSVELVYLGLAKSLRGQGVARQLLHDALLRLCEKHTGWTFACAVDRRNTPAIKLYESIGMRVFGERAALVRKL
jgi:ribosomal protein S18 acetylase RimI-like enzyme